MASLDDVVTWLKSGVEAINRLTLVMASLEEALANRVSYGSFTLAAAPTLTINNSAVQANSVIWLTATNASAADLMGSNKSLFVSAKSAGVSFEVTTANSTNAAGTETFDYVIGNPI